MCQSLFFNKVVGLRPETIQKETLAGKGEFCEISKNTFFTEHLWATSSSYFNASQVSVKICKNFLLCGEILQN